MYDVGEAVKEAFMTDGSYKILKIRFPQLFLEYTNEHIVKDSFSLDESFLEGNNLEFVGCIASKMEVTLGDLGSAITQIKKDTYVEVTIAIQTSDSISQETTIFKGYVDSAKKTANKKRKHIIAYDPFCKMQDIDVTNFYNTCGQTTVASLLGSLFTYIRSNSNMYQLSLENTTSSKLCNGWVTVDGGTTKKVSGLNALTLLKSICQINGVFGYFEPKNYGLMFCVNNNIKTSDSLVIPSESTYLGDDVYLVDASHGQSEDFYFSFYKEVEYEDFRVQPIDQVTIRMSSEEDDVWAGSGRNNYIIRRNLFMETASEGVKRSVAQNILNTIGHVEYVPFTSDNNGCPFIRCGDEVSYRDIAILDDDKQVHFIVFARTLKGDQVLRDSYKAEGDEYQHEFITEVSVNLSDIESRLDQHDKDIEDIKEALDEYGGGWRVESVDVLPSSLSDYTLYLLQGRAYYRNSTSTSVVDGAPTNQIWEAIENASSNTE